MIVPIQLIGQSSNKLTFKDLRKIDCEDVDESSSEKKQMRCIVIDVVMDGLNYFPSMTKKTDTPINSPEEAYNALRKLYPEYSDDQFGCWSEYGDYYCFSLDCGMMKNKSNLKCSFICLFYIRNGGDEFWYFVPHT